MNKGNLKQKAKQVANLEREYMLGGNEETLSAKIEEIMNSVPEDDFIKFNEMIEHFIKKGV